MPTNEPIVVPDSTKRTIWRSTRPQSVKLPDKQSRLQCSVRKTSRAQRRRASRCFYLGLGPWSGIADPKLSVRGSEFRRGLDDAV
jgi:hypothetical protein